MKRLGLKSITLKYLLGETNLKKDLLYFDKLIFDLNELKFAEMFVDMVGEQKLGSEFKDIYHCQKAELDFLQENNLIEEFDSNKLQKIVCNQENSQFKEYDDKNKGTSFFSHNDIIHLETVFNEVSHHSLNIPDKPSIFKHYFFSVLFNEVNNTDAIPILDSFIPENRIGCGQEYKILEVVLNKIPTIDNSVSWEQIIDYKNDPRNKKKIFST